MRPLKTRFPADPGITDPSGIIILGGGEDGSSLLTTGLPGVNEGCERFLIGMALARTHPDATVLLTGGSGQILSEGMSGADVAKRILAGGAIDEARVILEVQSRNTAENATYSLDLVEDRAGPWILVTSAFHTPRALGTFCAAGWRNLVPYPVDYRGLGSLRLGWDLRLRPVTLNTSLKEWIGIVAHPVSNRMNTLWPSSSC
jgi:uncharacterized SAM-binding protein YcdF (DUF218 family)